MSKYSICSLTIDPMTGSTREQEPNLHEVRETSVLTLYGVSTYTFAVAPSRARGLKPNDSCCGATAHVAPSRARGLKQVRNRNVAASKCRALTGAWIETQPEHVTVLDHSVAPSRARGLKRSVHQHRSFEPPVAPSRARGLKPQRGTAAAADDGRALTGAWIETTWG